MHAHRSARGFTLLEILAALAIGTLLMIGLVRLVVDSIEDTRGMQAGSHQQQVAAAAAKYLSANYATLTATATATVPAKVTVAQLRSAGFLPTVHADTNAFGQTPCLLVLQPSAGKLEALLVTEGGPAPIAARQLAYVAANAGPGAGFLPQQTPLVAQGAFGAWTISAATLANYLSANCSGTPAGAGHLASSLFYDGSNPVDFLYRSAVPGKPELNRMTTPLHMAALAVEDDTTDARCVAGDASTQGRIAADATGRLLTCQAGAWKAQGSAWWRDPVATFADLPATGNTVGHVRMVTTLGRGFTWTGTGWQALAVDQNGNMVVPGTMTTGSMQITTTATRGTSCPETGRVARETSGRLLVCVNGLWTTTFAEGVATTNALHYQFYYTAADGPQEFWIDLSAAGTQPLWFTGQAWCKTVSNQQSRAWIQMYDSAGNWLGKLGGCISSGQNFNAMEIAHALPLIKIPTNAAYVRINVDPGVYVDEYAYAEIMIRNAE